MWDRDFDRIDTQRQRLADTINAIPTETKSILDVGCGNGYFINSLLSEQPDRFDRVVGLDRSEEALSHVRSETIKSDIIKLPFDTGTFDLVTCLEVLEHLPYPDFQQALDELARVSRSHILISVPNTQDLRAMLVMCPKCHCCFNPYLHVRSFDTLSLTNLFSLHERVRCLHCREIGPMRSNFVQRHPIRGLRLFCWPTTLPNMAMCPQCKYQVERPKGPADPEKKRQVKRAYIESMAKTLSRVLSRHEKKRPWLLALYQLT